MRYEYDLSGRLLASRRAGMAASAYRYDAAGSRLGGVGEHAHGDARQAFAENELYRSGFSRSEARTNQAGEGPAHWAGSRVERITGNRCRFDAPGNLVERIGVDGEHLRLAYDDAQCLVCLLRDYADGA